MIPCIRCVLSLRLPLWSYLRVAHAYSYCIWLFCRAASGARTLLQIPRGYQLTGTLGWPITNNSRLNFCLITCRLFIYFPPSTNTLAVTRFALGIVPCTIPNVSAAWMSLFWLVLPVYCLTSFIVLVFYVILTHNDRSDSIKAGWTSSCVPSLTLTLIWFNSTHLVSPLIRLNMIDGWLVPGTPSFSGLGTQIWSTLWLSWNFAIQTSLRSLTVSSIYPEQPWIYYWSSQMSVDVYYPAQSPIIILTSHSFCAALSSPPHSSDHRLIWSTLNMNSLSKESSWWTHKPKQEVRTRSKVSTTRCQYGCPQSFMYVQPIDCSVTNPVYRLD